MKRLLLLVFLVMMVAWFAAVRPGRVRNRPDFSPLTVQLRAADRARRDAHRAAQEARVEAQRAVAEARGELRETLDEVNQEVRGALEEAAEEIRVAVDGIPVPILPGTRVVEALSQPPAPPAPLDLPEHPLAEAPPQPAPPPSPPSDTKPPGFPGLVNRPQAPPPPPLAPIAPKQNPPAATSPKETRLLTGLISATEDRAREEARKQLEQEVTNWLELAGVPRSWKPSPRQIDAMIIETKVEPVVKDYGTLYVAKLRVNVSPEQRAAFTESYQRQLVHRRLVFLAGTLGFVLICLGAISGYIRADEVTKGYYTNRLRLLAAGGVGAAGVVIYQMLT
jgi:hypothetical protein